MRIYKARSIAYRTGRLLGDYSAIRRGRVGRRLLRRAAGRMTGKALRRLFK